MDRESPEQKQILSRRDFLKSSAIIGFSLSSFLANSYYRIDATYNLPPKAKERYMVKTDEGYRIGVILGQHGKGKKATYIREQDLYKPVGAFFLDCGADYLDREVFGEVVDEALRKTSQDIPNFYGTIVEYGYGNDIPFIFGDTTIRDIDALYKQIDRPQQEGMLASSVTYLIEAGRQITKSNKENATRRDFLKLLLGTGVLSTAYFSSPAYTYILNEIGIKPDSVMARDFQSIFSDLIHPRHHVIVLRNIVWALKCRDFYENDMIAKDKIINIPGGLAHQFFDFFIRYPDIAKRYWEVFDYKNAAGNFTLGDTRWVYQSLIFHPSTRKTEIVEHSSLISLVKD